MQPGSPLIHSGKLCGNHMEFLLSCLIIMPRLRRQAKRAGRMIRRRAKRSGLGGTMAPMNQSAIVVETIDLNVGDPSATSAINTGLAPNTVYGQSFCLAQFHRAQSVAQSYRWYKPLEVMYEYTPRFNTFQQETGTNFAIPYFFSSMNRTGDNSFTANTLNPEQDFESQGSKPRTFTKKIVIKYKPNWLQPGLILNQNSTSPTGAFTGLQQLGATTCSKYLPCPNPTTQNVLTVPLTRPQYTGSGINVFQPGEVEYVGAGGNATSNASINTNGVYFYGHNVILAQLGAGIDGRIADVRVTVKWHFKNPARNPYTITGPRDPPVEVPTE